MNVLNTIQLFILAKMLVLFITAIKVEYKYRKMKRKYPDGEEY